MASARAGQGSRAGQGQRGAGGAASQLAALKAVGTGYPLRGQVKVAAERWRAGCASHRHSCGRHGLGGRGLARFSRRAPWATRIQLGSRGFRIERIITQELDRGAGFMNFAPRVMLPLSDLEATGLVGWGSRVTYRLLVAGPDAAAQAYQQWAVAEIDKRALRSTRVESLQNPASRRCAPRWTGPNASCRWWRCSSSMIAAVAIAMSARRYMQRHTDALRRLSSAWACRAAEILQAFGLEFLLLGIGGAAAGVALGYLAHYGLLLSLGNLLTVTLPQPSVLPAVVGVLAGIVLLAGFALPRCWR
ncbi:hypothetical protein ACU4HD_13780 [Cupriavidus basilensis]